VSSMCLEELLLNIFDIHVITLQEQYGSGWVTTSTPHKQNLG
jgi:hypothetical protein